MGKFQVQFCPLSLAHLSSIEISKHLWAHPKVRDVIKDTIAESLPRQQYTDDHLIKAMNLLKHRDKNEAILTEVFDKINQLQLPKPAKVELGIIVRSMGAMLWEWLERVNWWIEPALDWELYVDHARWKYNGCVDTAATIRSMYFSRKLRPNFATWILLCNHCLEDCIKDMWPTARLLKGHTVNAAAVDTPVVLFKKFSYILPFYWYCKLEDRIDDISTLFRQINDNRRQTYYDERFSVEETMFNIAKAHENALAVRYFWSVMDASQKQRQINRLEASRIYNYYIDIFDYRTDIDFIIFLWEHISATEDYYFFILTLGSNQVMRKLNSWPWEDSFLKTLVDSFERLKPFDCEKLICLSRGTLRQKMRDDDEESCNKWRNVTFMIWENIPLDVKKSLNYSYILEELFYMGDIEFLDCIINCEHLEDQRDRFLTCGIEVSHTRLYTFGGTDITDEFCEKVLRSDEERRDFLDRMERYRPPPRPLQPVLF